MTTDNESLKAVKSYADDNDLDLGWMARAESGAPRGTGRRGLNLGDIQAGSYGDAPDRSDNQTGKPRGAASRPGSFRIGGYSVTTKSDVWLTNAAMLYEGGVATPVARRRTYPGTP